MEIKQNLVMKSNDNIINEIELAEAYFQEACDKMDNRAYYEAAELAQNVLQLLENTTEYRIYAQTLTLLGVIYATLGNEGMSEDYYLKGLKWAEEDHEEYCHFFYNNLGCSYQLLHEYQKALHYFLLAEQYLETKTPSDSSSYQIWCLITKLNIIISYIELHQYESAEHFLIGFENKLNTESIPEDVQYTYLLTKTLLYLKKGRIDFVKKQCDTLMEGMESFSASDFYENVNRLCDIFHSVGRNDLWEKTLIFFEESLKEQESVYFQLVLIEKWIDFYHVTGQKERYIEACVYHTKLYLQQQNIWKKERATVLNTKIALYHKESEYKKVHTQRNTDYLTKLGNRYLLKEEYPSICQKAIDDERYLCLGIIDIDYFKNLNDTLGHLQGDHYLKKIAISIRSTIERYGNVYRYGGDEFILLFVIKEISKIDEIANTIKEKIENNLSDSYLNISVSQGYTYTCTQPLPDIDDLLVCADHELYFIKDHGRNSYSISNFREKDLKTEQ